MFEKLYAHTLRLVAPHFYDLYGDEATHLVRDRCRDEQGLLGKIRLCLDLLADVFVAACRDHRFAGHLAAPASATKPAPLFAVISTGPPHKMALLVGGAFSLGALTILPALIVHSARGHLTQPTQPSFAGTPRFSAPLALASLTPGPDPSIDANVKKRVLNGVIVNLRESYVYPNVARQMIDALLAHERNGAYKIEMSGPYFAALLTRHLQDVSHDLHLRVAYSATEVQAPLGPPDADPKIQRMAERDNCAFRKVEVLPDNIGYVKFDGFLPPAMCRDTVAASMRLLANVDALVFDLRENHGGDPRMVSFMASYLFDRRTHLNDIYNRLDNSTEEFWTSENVPGPKFGKKPVYVLTSAETFSGAEEFTYDLKNLKRALIVGETTAGGAHLVMMHRIDPHFIVGVPFARPINPISKTDWEGTGVIPDVPVKAQDALDTAKKLAAKH